MPLPQTDGTAAVVGLAAVRLFGPTTLLNHLPAVANPATAAVTGVDALLLHRGFAFLAGLGTHVLQPLGHIRGFLPVDFAFDVDLPQPCFHRWLGLRLPPMRRDGERTGYYPLVADLYRAVRDTNIGRRSKHQMRILCG